MSILPPPRRGSLPGVGASASVFLVASVRHTCAVFVDSIQANVLLFPRFFSLRTTSVMPSCVLRRAHRGGLVLLAHTLYDKNHALDNRFQVNGQSMAFYCNRRLTYVRRDTYRLVLFEAR